ncbi:hypothetical protein C122C_0804 [Leuconostoc gelidum subsp. gasicomitatum]|uniref:Uncharacterized protein n=1 Tax=Leuconostoc gasicomitatum TaxID=115778 RepID=A0ABP2B732_9LACO|nr:transcriptional regulator [Leuconostoc gasicomitatum]CUW10444.1 hypothetical protein C122C_0804 [Leuconostoc gasicomitatum]
MNTRQQDIVISRKEVIEYYAHSKYNSHIGRVVAQGMLDLDYTYSQLAKISGLKDSTNVRLIVRGQQPLFGQKRQKTHWLVFMKV